MKIGPIQNSLTSSEIYSKTKDLVQELRVPGK